MPELDQNATQSKTVLLSGGSGMLGSAISTALAARGNRILRLTRHKAQGQNELQWNPTAATDSHAKSTHSEGNRIADNDIGRLEAMDAAIHLSGANVSSHRWTDAYKREMWESRVTTTRALAELLAGLRQPPPVLVVASAVGFYGNRGDAVMDEDSPAGTGYFPDLCKAWEEAAQPAVAAGIRVVHLRFGMVIGADGGAMARLLPLFKLGLGGRLGSGRQWMSWVSEADVVGAALFALDGNPRPRQGPLSAAVNLSGAVNVVAPQPVTNAEFTRVLGRAVHRPAIMPAPAFALRLAFGEMADEALLASTRVIPARLLDAGFAFRHPTLAEAFAAAIKH